MAPEEWIETLKDIDQVLRGSHIETPEASAAIVKMILKGEALRLFKDGLTEYGLEDIPANCLYHVTTQVFPTRTNVRQKCYMRQEMHKGQDVSV